MALSISDLTPEGRRYFEQLQKLSRLEVQVGFQEGQTYEDGTSLADVAAYNELGTSDSPARPFMRQSFENHEPELKAACDQVNKTLAEGGTTERPSRIWASSARALCSRRSSMAVSWRISHPPSRRKSPSSR